MYKKFLNFLIFILISFYLGLIFIMPFKWHYIGMYSEIFPAFDLVIIYYISTYLTIKNWHLFIIGFLLDQLYQIPLGASSLSLIIANLILNQIRSNFFLKDYFTNLFVFCLYSAFILISRFLIVTIDSVNYIEGIDIYFYYLTTIFAYPILSTLIKKPLDKIVNYVK